MNLKIILHKPQMGENIGAAARIMHNFGYADLRIVSPRDGWPNEKAQAMAAGGEKIVENAQVFENLKDAISDLNFLVATSAELRSMEKPICTPEQAVKIVREKRKVGFLFGCERTGLTNEELAMADLIIQIPTHEQYRSINLAQAVCIVCYEFSKMLLRPMPKNEISEQATKEELENMIIHLEGDLDSSGFFKNEDMRDSMKLNLRNMFTRAALTSQEVQTMRGVIKSLSS